MEDMTRINFFTKIFFSIFILFISSCGLFTIYINNPTTSFQKIMNEKENYSNFLRFDGYYSLESFNKDTGITKEPIFFYNNNLLYFYFRSIFYEKPDIDFLKKTQLISTPSKFYWGSYYIINDTILKCKIFCLYSNKRANCSQFIECNYSGIIRNKERIIDWHLIEPYPNINYWGDKKIIENEKKCRNLIFNYFKEKSKIDSTSSWLINKVNEKGVIYRKNENNF